MLILDQELSWGTFSEYLLRLINRAILGPHVPSMVDGIPQSECHSRTRQKPRGLLRLASEVTQHPFFSGQISLQTQRRYRRSVEEFGGCVF